MRGSERARNSGPQRNALGPLYSILPRGVNLLGLVGVAWLLGPHCEEWRGGAAWIVSPPWAPSAARSCARGIFAETGTGGKDVRLTCGRLPRAPSRHGPQQLPHTVRNHAPYPRPVGSPAFPGQPFALSRLSGRHDFYGLSASHPLLCGLALSCGDAIVVASALGPALELPRRGALMVLGIPGLQLHLLDNVGRLSRNPCRGLTSPTPSSPQ